jgi:hypothetical protein
MIKIYYLNKKQEERAIGTHLGCVRNIDQCVFVAET